MKRLLSVLVLLLLLVVPKSVVSANEPLQTERYIEENGAVWVKVTMEEDGMAIVTDEGRTLARMDHLGGLYFDGDVYIDGEKLEKTDKQTQANNYLIYTLLTISLAMNVYTIFIKNNNSGKR